MVLATGHDWLLAAAVETLSEALLQWLSQTGAAVRLLLSAERLQALDGRAAKAPCALGLPPSITLVQLQQLAAVTSIPGDTSVLGSSTQANGEELAWSAALMMCSIFM